MFPSSSTDPFISGSVSNVKGGVGSQQEQALRDLPVIPTKEFFLKSPFLYSSSDKIEKIDEQSATIDDAVDKQKKERLKKILSNIIVEKLGNNVKKSVSTRGLITLLSLLSVAEAEEETELVPNPSTYQTGLRDSSELGEKPYFDTVDVVVGGITNSGFEK